MPVLFEAHVSEYSVATHADEFQQSAHRARSQPPRKTTNSLGEDHQWLHYRSEAPTVRATTAWKLRASLDRLAALAEHRPDGASAGDRSPG